MSDCEEYELTFSINYRRDGEVVEEIGFAGILGDYLGYLAHVAISTIQNHDWETEEDQPDPDDVPEMAVDYIPRTRTEELINPKPAIEPSDGLRCPVCRSDEISMNVVSEALGIRSYQCDVCGSWVTKNA